MEKLKHTDGAVRKPIYVLGVGHNTPVFIDLALACGYMVSGLYHYNGDRTGTCDHGLKILGSFEDLFSLSSLQGRDFLLTMGDNGIRTALSDRIMANGGNVPSLVHPTAVVSVFADIHPVGVYISPFTYVQADSYIGCNTMLLSHVNISHTTRIGRGCFIAGGAMVGAYTVVEDFVFIGQGALSISSKVPRIGTHAYVGAGALLTREVPSYAVMAGAPASVVKMLKDE